MTPDEAKQAYRDAWQNYCLCQDPKRKEELERVMDGLQPKICRGPGPEWDEFSASLPGFREFWNRWVAEIREKAEAKIKASSDT